MASNYTYKFLYDKNGYPIYPRTSLTAIDMTLANGLATIGDKLVITYATPEQIRAGATGLLISADGLKEALESFGDTLYTAGDGIKIEGGVISADIAPVNSILDGTIDTTKVIINKNLNGALGVGRAIDMPIHIDTNNFTETTYDETRTENGSSITTTCIKLVRTSPTNGAFYYYSWNSRPAFIQNHRYLFIADIKAVTGSVRVALCANNSNITTDNFRVFDENGNKLPAYEDDDPVNHTHRLLTTDYQRFAVITVSNGQSGLFFKAAATTNIDIRLRYFKIFDVTGLSDETISALATHRSPDNSCSLHLIEADSVCPWMETIALAGSSIVVQPGRSYKLTATDGAIHTLNVVPLLSDTYGKDTYITIVLDGTSAIQAVRPLVLVDSLKPNAANNCVIKYRDGYARLYVNDTDYGYIVTVTGSGTTNGTLYYGLFSTTEDYILFSHATDEVDCVVSTGGATIPSTTAATRVVTGNGKNTTIANFNNTALKAGKSLTFSDITIKNTTITGGSISLSSGVLNNVTMTTGTLVISNDIDVLGTVTHNSGTFTLTNVVMNGNNSGVLHFGPNTTGVSITTPITIKNMTITGSSVNYVPLVITNANVVIDNCHVSDIENHNTNRVQGAVYGTALVVNTASSLKTVSISNSTFSNIVNIRYSSYDSYGGAILIGGNNNVNLYNVTMTGCTATHAGACLVNNASSVINIANCVATQNYVLWYCGAFWLQCSFTVTGSIISGNRARYRGGGLGARASGTITNTIITGNSADQAGGGVVVDYGGINVEITSSTISSNTTTTGAGIFLTGNSTIGVYSCLIEGNSASSQGSAIDVYGSGAYCYVEDCTIRNNVGAYDTVFAYTGGKVKLKYCTITGNTTTGNSAAMASHVSGAVFEAESCTISENMSKGQAIIAAGQSCSLSMLNCTIEGNTVTTYGTLCMEGVAGTMSIAGCVVKNNIGQSGRGGTFTGQNTVLNITDSIFDENQDILFGTSSTNNCQVIISGSNVFRSSVSGTYESITISANSVLDLRGNPVTDAIKGATITTLGMITVLNRYGLTCNHLARAVTTGSTITNDGYWYPSPPRLVIPSNTTASFRGYNLSNNTVTAAGGGGVNATAGNIDVDIYDTTISNNTGSYQGTGVYTYGNTDKVTLHNCVVNNCQIYPVYANNQSTIDMYGCTVSNCYTTYDVIFAYSSSHINAYNCLIVNNRTADYGDMAIGAHINSECNITGCTVSYNWANHCAGYHIANNSYGTATNCLIKGNTATAGGGGAGMWLAGATMSLVRCTFENNVAQYGAGVCCNNSNCYLNITDCIFNNGQDVYCYTSNCQVKLYGRNEFRALVSCTNGCITIASESTINLRNNPVDNAIVGGTIAVLGNILTVEDNAGRLHQYPARTVTGSTITNRGAWLPTPRLYYNTANTVAELTGVILSDFTITSTSVRAVDIQNSGTNSTITLNNIEINRNTLTTGVVGVLLNVYASGTKLIINGGTISENDATYADNQHLVYTATASTISLTGVLMENNKVSRSCVATNGKHAVIYINASTITNNYCTRADCALWAHSGSIYATNCLVTGNTTPQYDSPAVIAYTANSYISLTGCVITNNVSNSINGGVGAHTSARVDVVNCYISGNISGTNGGGLLCDVDSTMTVSGSTVTGNTATYGSCAYIGGNSTISFTGGNTLDGTIYFAASSGQIPKLNLSGVNHFTGYIAGTYSLALITISTGAVLNFTGNTNTNVIPGGTVSVQGAITVIDKNGSSHTVNSGTYTKITNMGVAS